MGNQFSHFEDYQVGQKGITNARTVTEADVVTYACISADFNPIHVDRYSTADNIYGGRVAHGMLGSSLATGMLSYSAPHILGGGVSGAYFYGFDANYRGAIALGDTIKIQWQVAETNDDPTHQGFGLVKTAFQVVNQDGLSVYDGTFTTKVRKESAENADLQLKPGVPWPAGEYTETHGRTITETDIVNFACLTGDYAPQYMDAEFARESMFGKRIAQGILVFSIAIGIHTVGGQYRSDGEQQRSQEGKIGLSKIAGHLNDNASFLAPVKIGDTIRSRYRILTTRVSKSRPEASIVTQGFQVVNQRDEVVQEGHQINMAASTAGSPTKV